MAARPSSSSPMPPSAMSSSLAPQASSQLLNVSGIGQEKADRFGAAICAICDSRTTPGEYGAPTSAKSSRSNQVQTTDKIIQSRNQNRRHNNLFRRNLPPPTRLASAPTEILTAEQQQLDQRLRDWRKDASEELGLPQFFVLGSSTLRSIVLTRPRNIAQLRSIAGIGPEKVEKYGASICEICNA